MQRQQQLHEQQLQKLQQELVVLQTHKEASDSDNVALKKRIAVAEAQDANLLAQLDQVGYECWHSLMLSPDVFQQRR